MNEIIAYVSVANEIEPSGEMNFDFKVTDNPIYELLGQLTVAWSDLDYVLRTVLKRKKGFAQDSVEFETILDYRHSQLIDELIKEFNGEPFILKKIMYVGKERKGGHLYARRNHYCHGFWAVNEQGNTYCQRIMSAKWREATPYEELDLKQLIQEIAVTSMTLNGLVPAPK